MIGWILLGLLLLLVIVLAVRTLRFTAPAPQAYPPAAAEADAQRAAQALSALVRCKTVSHQGREDDDEAEFARLEALLPTLFPLTHQACPPEKIGDRGLMYRWRGKTAGDPLLLTAHYDVVPADPAGWARDPFGGEIAGGFVHGRGTLDTKGTLTAILTAVETLLEKGFTPERDVYLCFGGDEEVMGLGAAAMAQTLQERGVRPLMTVDEGGAIVEKVFPGVSLPYALIGVAEKGSVNYRLTATSKGGHSSAPPAHTPVDILARACLAIRRKPFRFRVTEPAGRMVDGMARRSTPLYRLIFANLWLFQPALNLMCRLAGGELNALFRTTVAFTVLRGGDAANVLPKSAELVLNARILPGETAQGTLTALRRKVGDPRLSVELLQGLEPSGISGVEGPGYAALARAIGEVYPGVAVSPYLMIAASDARHYERICPHVYRFSGMPLSAAERRMIHGVDERIPQATLADTARFFIRLIRGAAGGA